MRLLKPGTTTAILGLLLSLLFDACAPAPPKQAERKLPAPQIQLSDEPVEIPAEIIEGRIVVQLSVNGTGPWHFFFDTGAGLDGVRQELAGAMQLTPIAKATLKINDSGGHFLCQPADLQLGPITYRSSAISASTLFDPIQHLEGRRIDGILGAGLLSVASVRIDFDRQKLILAPLDSQIPSGDRISVEFRRNRPFIPIDFELAGKTITNTIAMVDTGHGGGLGLNLTRLRELGFSPEEQGWFAVESTTITRRDAGWAGKLARVRLGPHTLAEPTFGAREHHGGEDGDALLGSALLSKFNITFSRNAIYLEPSQTFSEPFPFDASGLAIRAYGDDFRTFVVEYIRPGSPAAESGVIQTGDQIVAVDGKPPSDLRLWTLRKHLRQHGHRCNLRLRRGTSEHDMTLTLRKPI